MMKMDTGIYLIFLIFCTTLYQEILTFSEEHIEKSQDLHIRRKRIIDKTLNGNKPVTIQHVPYIVNVRRSGRPNCGGSILTSKIVLTAAHCVFDKDVYSVLSGSAYVNQGIEHNVTGKLVHHFFNLRTKQDDIALLYISPAIDLDNSPNRKIELFEGNVPAHALGTISGWGCIDESGPEMKYPKHLRSIVVPILRDGICEFLYSFPHVITYRNICTYDHSNNKCGSIGDSGGPLVVDNKLVGVLSWSRIKEQWDNPDVFIKVSHPILRNWIVANTRIIEGW